MNKIKENINHIFICPCPNNNCITIPEISYSFEPLNSIIKYKCNNTKTNILIEEKIKLGDFLKNTSTAIQCSLCKGLIFEEELFFAKNNKKLYHIDCLKICGFPKNDEYIKINSNFLFNYCLEHNNKYMFYCKNCKASLCLKCDIESHNDKGHIILQINSLRNNKHKIEDFKSMIIKQKALLNKIKDMFNRLFQSLENNITIKEQILENYENNCYNYQSIQNFDNFKLGNNKKYENLLDDIMNKYKEFERNKINTNIEEIFINTILSPLYYSMMINDNTQYNDKIITLFNKKINYINKENTLKIEKSKNKYSDMDNFLNNNLEINIKKKDDNNYNYGKKNNKFSDKIENKNLKHKEINNIKQEKSIYNMKILHSGNIALSSNGNVIIYDSNNLLSSKENEYLQKINISKDQIVIYVFEFLDETLLCSIIGKIFHLKLIDNDKKYNILGIIKLDKEDYPSKLISLGNSFLAVLTLMKGYSFIRLFVKVKETENNNKYIKGDIKKINNNEDWNSDEQKEDIINDNSVYLDKIAIKKDKYFYPYSENNHLNLYKKLLCSIFEIKNNNNYQNTKRVEYKFITTSNSIYYFGEDKLIFYSIKSGLNENIECKVNKKIDISCSTESDSICQLNNHFLCVGLQNHYKNGQINGFAIINIEQKEISKIIKNFPIDSLYFNLEKKILISASDIVDNDDNHIYNIGLYKVVEKRGEIDFKKIYLFKSGHNDIIVSLFELENKRNEEIYGENNNKEFVLISASMDANLKLIKIKI